MHAFAYILREPIRDVAKNILILKLRTPVASYYDAININNLNDLIKQKNNYHEIE